MALGGRVTFRSNTGFSPLLAAAQRGHTDISGLLLAHGSNVNEVAPDTKHTALQNAAAKGHNALVEALLSWGAEVNPKDFEGWTVDTIALFLPRGTHALCSDTIEGRGQPHFAKLPIHRAAI